jgi:hypothetical protein
MTPMGSRGFVTLLRSMGVVTPMRSMGAQMTSRPSKLLVEVTDQAKVHEGTAQPFASHKRQPLLQHRRGVAVG